MRKWHPIERAPKSTIVNGCVRAIYILGYCPEQGANPESCISVVWWEPGENAWWSDGEFPYHPTHWMPLPAPPVTKGENKKSVAEPLPMAPHPRGNTKGWKYFNEDEGAEWSVNHPLESGECDDATAIVRMTFSEFRRQYPINAAAPK